MVNGGYSKKFKEKHNIISFNCEYYGFLNFCCKNSSKRYLVGIEIILKKYVTSQDDPFIFFPEIESKNIKSKLYMFHTHPQTYRFKEGFIYELPSFADIKVFIKYANIESLNGSLVMAPEGIYCIKLIKKGKSINVDLYSVCKNEMAKCRENIYSKYKYLLKGEDEVVFNNLLSLITIDMEYINVINSILKKINIKIKYYPKQQRNNMWIYGSIYMGINNEDKRRLFNE